MHSGIRLLDDTPGDGDELVRQRTYHCHVRMWLNKGDPIRWSDAASLAFDPEGTTQVGDLWLNRAHLIDGLFYGMEGMRIGGKRRIKVAPHMAYGERGLPGIIPTNAALVIEVAVLSTSHAAPAT